MYRVLIVEDEIIVRAWLKKQVNWALCGLVVCGEAGNGREALEVYEREKPDVILTDLRMPVMDGITLVQKIRERDRRIRILILTCLDEFTLVKQAIGLDVTSYILKLTSEPDEIEAELKKACDFLKRYGGKEAEATAVSATEMEKIEEAAASSDEEPSVVQENIDIREGVNPRYASALDYIKIHYADNISLQQVAEHVGVTPNYLGKIFLKNSNCTFTDVLNQLRIQEAKHLLDDPSCRIYEVAEKTGFVNTTYFFRVFKKYEGCTPTEYRIYGGKK